MSHFYAPSIMQLCQLAVSIKDYVDAKSGGESEAPDLSKYDALIKGKISIDELNAWENKGNSDLGLYIVVTSNGTPMGMLICGAITMAAQCMIYIGPTATSPGKSATLSAPTTSAYSKQPGISMAVRYNAILGSMFFGSNIPNGLSDWEVITLATYKEGFQLGGGGKTWKGTKAEYDAIATKDPDTVYFVTR